ncbi:MULTISPECIES: hypothetical protein [Pseudomonas]|jgi:hypothetical protein|uniref:hypothetical protein n=1 Tax=Pseudomonas TaxID=286 RepID=UPI0013006724|nr:MULTISPECIES: hypothetical protein [Pseudomonas]MDD2033761.1 hypothetical protein [Pseudomonas sp. 39167]MEA1028205.1 hypothetical protein [Pseudomonas sp. N-137]
MLIDIIQLDFFILQGRLVGFFGWFALKNSEIPLFAGFFSKEKKHGEDQFSAGGTVR